MKQAELFDVQYNEQGKIVDFLEGIELDAKPEEIVRQRFLRTLHYEFGYPRDIMRREIAIRSGSKDLNDLNGNPIRADIAVYRDKTACVHRDQGRIHFVVECKAPSAKDGYNQLVSYIYNTSAEGGIWFNGSGEDDEIEYYRRIFKPNNELRPWIGIPRFGESWDALGRRRKDELLRPKDIRGLLRRCHNKLHGRGHDGEEEDLTMDMVRIILAKAMDEESPDELPSFYCTPDEYLYQDGIKKVADRVDSLFEQTKLLNADVFSEHEKISVGPRAVADVVVEFQDFQLMSDLSSSADWDIMGHAYEQYTATYLKKVRGQFFTNRRVIDLLVAMIDPEYSDLILDPAGGSGGFLTGVMRYVRRKILEGQGTPTSKQRQLDRHRTRLFMVEISRRLVKVAKTAMILNGDGHTGMTTGDSLGDYSGFDKTILAQASRGMPTVILTNPPFAGVGEGRVTQSEVLHRFATGVRWRSNGENYHRTDELLSEGAPPEMLFFERCLDWLAPGGKLGIVMPKSFLDTQTYRPARALLFEKARLLAVINCHKNTFQPHTGVRTCLLLVPKRKLNKQAVEEDYDIFMAISRKVGQDSEGVPIFKRDPHNNPTDEIDEDLTDIANSYREYRLGKLASSGYCFSIKRSALDGALRINPQMFLPHLNETLEAVELLDGSNGWTVMALSQLESDVKVFKGPRFKSESIIVEQPGPGVEPYYTPSAILQEKSNSVKLLDLTKATSKQKATIAAIRVKRGDIVITRSGSIGRVVYITRRYNDSIVSDDLIRVRINEENLRLYVFQFLQSTFAQDQMLMNEYGAIQQHLEPEHVRNILVPIPGEEEVLAATAEEVRKAVQLKEALEEQSARAASRIGAEIESAIDLANEVDEAA